MTISKAWTFIVLYLNSRTSDDHPYPLAPICTAIGQDIYQCWYTHGSVIVTSISLLVVTLFEVFEVIRTRLSYFKQFENFVILGRKTIEIKISDLG